MATETNLFPDPKFQTSDGEAILARNQWHNPSPTDSLDQYSAEGSASIMLDSAVSIRGEGGIIVSSSDSNSGIKFTLNDYLDERSKNFTVYVRAHSAMTITGSQSSEWTLQDDQYVTVGWGDFGWGEPNTYVKGFSYTFEAGEVKRFRIYSNVLLQWQGGNFPGTGDIHWEWHLKGAGTFDVDAVWVNAGVDDGVGDGDQQVIANAPLYFDGDTEREGYTFEWEGTPRASPSIMKAEAPEYASGITGWDPQEGFNNTFLITLPGGEKAVGLQGATNDNSYDALDFITASGDTDLRGLGLVEGKHYVLSYDLVSLYENYFEGDLGGLWDNVYAQVRTSATYNVGVSSFNVPFPHPFRARAYLPFTVGAEPVNADVTAYRNWLTGVTAVTSVAIHEVPFVSALLDTYSGDVDLTAAGVVAGQSYMVNLNGGIREGEAYRFEYQTGSEDWTLMTQMAYDPDWDTETFIAEFTVPANATAVRATGTIYWGDFYVFTPPPPFFYGDTPDADGYWYYWSGTPGMSASIRSTEPPEPPPSLPIVARVLMDGQVVPVSDMRVKMSDQHIRVLGWKIT